MNDPLAENTLQQPILPVAIFGSPIVQWGAILFFLLGIGAGVVRIQKQYDVLGGPFVNDQVGMFDFHCGIYQPALALRHGVIPYSRQVVTDYQMIRPIPAYSPFLPASHIPLTFLPLHVAETVYFIAVVVMICAVALLVLKEATPAQVKQLFFPLAAFMVLSRSGQSTLVTGYFTMELVLGTILALRYAHDRPWIAAVGVLLASGKPTYAVPIGIVMLARGNYRALLPGVTLSIVGALIPLICLSQIHGWSGIVEAFRAGQEDHMADPIGFPTNSWTRIDFPAVVCKWLGVNPAESIFLLAMIPMIAWPVLKLRQLRAVGDFSGATSPSGAVAILAVLTSLYHHIYDSMIVVAPMVGLLFGLDRGYRRLGWVARLVIVVLISTPLWNYTSSEAMLLRLPDNPGLRAIIASVNGVLLLIGFGWLLSRIPKD